MPQASGIADERVEEIRIDRRALAIAALLLRHRRFEAALLLGRVGELAVAVGELDAAGVELEALRQPWIDGRAGQRRLRHRILVEQRRRAEAEPRLDALDQHAAEDIGPGVVIGDLDVRRHRGGGEGGAIGYGTFECRQQIDAGELLERPGDGQQPRRRVGIGGAVLPLQLQAAGGLGGLDQQAPRNRPSGRHRARWSGTIPAW